jgi:hypothetical protein
MGKAELGQVLKNWDREVSSVPHTQGEANPYATARHRKTPAKPITDSLKGAPKPKSGCRILYHGMGKDTPGLKRLQKRCTTVGYDKYAPDAALKKKPSGQFDEVYSVFTLNTIPKAEAKQVVRELHDRLKPGGRAVIATRSDVCTLAGVSLKPK